MSCTRYVDDMNTIVHHGLEGVVAAETALSMVDGERGELIIAGYPVAELALNATFEETVSLLWNESVDFVSRRALPQSTLDFLASASADRIDAMDALRMALPGGSGNDADDARDVVALFPTAVAAYWRL